MEAKEQEMKMLLQQYHESTMQEGSLRAGVTEMEHRIAMLEQELESSRKLAASKGSDWILIGTVGDSELKGQCADLMSQVSTLECERTQLQHRLEQEKSQLQTKLAATEESLLQARLERKQKVDSLNEQTARELKASRLACGDLKSRLEQAESRVAQMEVC